MRSLAEQKHDLVQQADMHRQLIASECLHLRQRGAEWREEIAGRGWGGIAVAALAGGALSLLRPRGADPVSHNGSE